ncbi:unnamed protein product [Brachionus calyciflorus]|uniref:Uncharacterized protein n=1 Tax=Brachionus calyciflorus TaxID=104777 RepID=A0A814K2M0_9BILA|nr:unnamed protein product [Brachionus calyciflorus]
MTQDQKSRNHPSSDVTSDLTGLNEHEKLYCFAEGLNSKTKFEVKPKQCKTLEEAFRVASIFKSCCGNMKIRVRSTNKTVSVCKTSSDSILSIVGFVNGTPVKLALDSGAVEFILLNKIVERLGLKIYESNVQGKTATDDVKKVLGETEEVNVDIECHT